MNRKILRTQGKRFCEVEINLEDGRLSVYGTEGRIVRRTAARKEALAYWVSYFEDNPEEIIRLGRRTARGAAKYVLDTDGEYHGLDVHSERWASDGRNKNVFLVESCGQITDTIREFFPELAPLLKWHLNDMRAGCAHQEAEKWAERPIDPSKPTNTYGTHFPGQRHASWNMLVWVRPDEHAGGLLGVPCPTCGYKYGTAWNKAELPPEIVRLAETGAAEAIG